MYTSSFNYHGLKAFFPAGVTESHAEGSIQLSWRVIYEPYSCNVISVRLGASKHFRCVAMDSNKDEAERCIKIALSAISNNQQDKARKFLEKAERLFPTEKAKSTSNKSLFQRGFYVSWWAIAVKPNQLTLA